MEDIYKSTLLLIHALTQLNGVCNQYSEFPTDINGEKIIDIIDKCEEKFLKVKTEIVTMVKDIESKTKEDTSEISAISTKVGFLINKDTYESENNQNIDQ